MNEAAMFSHDVSQGFSLSLSFQTTLFPPCLFTTR